MRRHRGGRRHLPRLVLMSSLLLGCGATRGADLMEANQQFLTGNYAGCIASAREALRDSPDNEAWQIFLSKALLETGQYPAALTAITNALEQVPWSIRLRWQARQVFLSNGRANAADQMVQEVIRMVSRRPRDYRDAPSIVVFGEAALLAGADPKRVLDTVYQTAKETDPKLRDVYLASGNLALAKHDFALAAKQFQEGLKQLPDDPDLNCGLARAYADSDAALASAAVEAALSRNSNHVGCLLLLVDNSINAENYVQAEKLLDRIKAINPWDPDAWAYRAVLANLQNQPQAELAARQNALKYWPTNPRVDYLIGLNLAQKYRFAEGVAHQRQALKFDAKYLPAKIQLAQDLLRLGEETEGWKLAEEVQKQDGYDVQAYNLANLHDVMDKFVTLMNGSFRVRMSKHEAALYGPQVLDLLARAKTNLCAKYGLDLKQPTTVEIFPQQKDFSVRTFGLPGDPGYLAVCFGSVITANSPASQTANPENWKDVLWHEFCHVVTLHLSHNKMPRWLSEGISVYEERQANPAWGEHMNPQYREMVLDGDLMPISKLSSAFLTPRSSLYLQFAYYESSLVVEFIVQRFGLDQLKAILRDLGDGMEINEVLAQQTEPMEKLEKDFTAFARDKAEKLAPGLNWDKPEFASLEGAGSQNRRSRSPLDVPMPPAPRTNTASSGLGSGITVGDRADWDAWAVNHLTNYWVMTQTAETLVETKQWVKAKPLLQQLIQLYPNNTGGDSPYPMLAAAYRALGETNEEREVLTRFADMDSKAPDAYLRLMRLDAAVKDWPAVARNAERYLAVNPLVAPPYRFLAEASAKTGQAQAEIEAYQALLELDPPDPAEVHFHLAEALFSTGNSQARRQVLEALEEAPLYRPALRLLLKINGESLQPATGEAASDTLKP